MPTYAYVLFVALAISWVVRNKSKLLSIKHSFGGIVGDPLRVRGDGSLSLEQRWAVGAGADLALRNVAFLDALPTGLPNSRELLAEWWGIETREDALDMLRHLVKQGHRADYQQVVSILRSQPEARQNAVVEQTAIDYDLPDLVDTYESVLAARSLLDRDGLLRAEVPLPSILAWDLGRLINICRWCYDVGLLSEQECWSHMLPAASVLQREYGSWSELSLAYLTGFVVWKGGEPGPEYDLLKSNRALLLSDARSPWQQLAWWPDATGELVRA